MERYLQHWKILGCQIRYTMRSVCPISTKLRSRTIVIATPRMMSPLMRTIWEIFLPTRIDVLCTMKLIRLQILTAIGNKEMRRAVILRNLVLDFSYCDSISWSFLHHSLCYIHSLILKYSDFFSVRKIFHHAYGLKPYRAALKCWRKFIDHRIVPMWIPLLS